MIEAQKMPKADQYLLDTMTKFKETHAMIIMGQKNLIIEQLSIAALLSDDEDVIIDESVQFPFRTLPQLDEIFAYDKLFYTYEYLTEEGEIKEKLAEVKLSVIIKEGLKSKYLNIPHMKRYKTRGLYPSWVGNDDSDDEIRFNIFGGFPYLKTMKQDKDVEEVLLNMLRRIYNEESINLIIQFFATMYQNPTARIRWALILTGLKGTGKNTLEEILGKNLIHSDNYFRTADQGALFGRFTAHLEPCMLIVGQEITWGGSHKEDSKVKELVTEDRIKIEPKGIDSYMSPFFARFAITSNADWVIPATKAERRWYVTRTLDDAIDITDKEWKEFRDLVDNEKGRRAIMYFLMNYDIKDFPYNKAPAQSGNLVGEQVTQGLYGLNKYLHNIVEDGCPHFETRGKKGVDKKETLLRTSVLYGEFKEEYPKDKLTMMKFSVEFRKALGATVHKTCGVKYSLLPSRSEVAANLLKYSGGKVDISIHKEETDLDKDEFELVDGERVKTWKYVE